MAPSELLLNHFDQPRNFSSYLTKNSAFGLSKAQLSLQKILHTILTIPCDPSLSNQQSFSTSSLKQSENEIKPPKMEGPGSPAAPSCEGLAENVHDHELKQEKVQAVEEIDNKGKDYMGLLIEAAKLIFGEIKEDEKQSFDDFEDESTGKGSEKSKVKRRSQSWTVDLLVDMEMEPVVRSKRGRTQVLPCKFRDSVLEPLTRVSRNRSTVIPNNKRRLR